MHSKKQTAYVTAFTCIIKTLSVFLIHNKLTIWIITWVLWVTGSAVSIFWIWKPQLKFAKGLSIPNYLLNWLLNDSTDSKYSGNEDFSHITIVSFIDWHVQTCFIRAVFSSCIFFLHILLSTGKADTAKHLGTGL